MIRSLPPSAIVPALLLVPCLGRYAMVIPGTTLPYARRESGTAERFVRHATVSSLLIPTAVALILSWSVAGRQGLGLFGVVGLGALILRAIFARTLGGVTGDALGATAETLESVLLLSLLLMNA